MKSREELVGAEVLALAERIHTLGHHRHGRLRKHLNTAIQALTLVSLAHRLAPTRSRRLMLATGAYLQHRGRHHGRRA